MKNLIIVTLFFLASVSCANPSKEASTATPVATGTVATGNIGKTLVVGVKGMHCKSCSDGLTKTIGALPEVAHCNVDLKTKQATIALKEGMTLEKAQLAKVIEDSGYSMTSMKEKSKDIVEKK